MIIENITLLSVEEFHKYKKYIPVIKNAYWMRGPETEDLDTAYYVRDKNVFSDGLLYDRLGVRPLLVVSDLYANPGDKIRFLNENWIVLDSNLILCCNCIFTYYFDTVAGRWKSSYLKTKIEEWLQQKLKATNINVYIKNHTEFLFLQSFCKKYNLNGYMDTELINYLIHNPASDIYITYSPYLKWTLSETTSESKTFSEFCDYIIQEKNHEN